MDFLGILVMLLSDLCDLPLRAAATAALVLVLVGQALQPGWDLLLGLHQNVQ